MGSPRGSINSTSGELSAEQAVRPNALDKIVHRYLQPWLAVYDPDSTHPSKAEEPGDRMLHALADLTALRLNVDRCYVSVVDSENEFCLAECVNGLRSHRSGLNTSSRFVGQSIFPLDHVRASPTVKAVREWQKIGVPPRGMREPFILNDLQDTGLHPREHHDNDSPPVRFFAAIPLLYTTDEVIGAVCIADSDERADRRRTLNEEELAFVRDQAITISYHLDLVMSKALYGRQNQMMKGLGLLLDAKIDPHGADPKSLSKNNEDIQDDPRAAPRDVTTDAAESLGKPRSSSPQADLVQSFGELSTAAQAPVARMIDRSFNLQDEETTVPATGAVFALASGLIRRAGELEGVVFLDVTADADNEGDRQQLAKPPQNTATVDDRKTSGSSGNADTLGYSLASGEGGLEKFAFPQQLLQEMIARFPKGELFTRDQDGAIYIEKDGDMETSSARVVFQELEDTVNQSMPMATNFAFFPLWTLQKKRWQGTALAWSEDKRRVFNRSSDMSAFKAFSNGIMTEMARIDANDADETKTKFLSSISHELRSPLHGILAGVEFVRDAPIAGFAKHMLDTIESCGRTLLDTIEHVLDFTNISSLTQPSTSIPRSPSANQEQEGLDIVDKTQMQTQQTLEDPEIDMMSMIEEVMMSALLGHITEVQAANAAPLRKQTGSASTRSNSGEVGSLMEPRLPQVVLRTDWRKEWVCKLPAGALRRIVLNLFSNALKFTTSGHIVISATFANDSGNPDSLKGTSMGTLKIQDTGRGMSEEFLKHHAGMPFTQESILSPGTGLGLHLVRQIVRDLGGALRISSRLGSGTTIEADLPTLHFLDPTTEDVHFSARSVSRFMKDKHAFLMGWEHLEDSKDSEGIELCKQSFLSMFRNCFGMDASYGKHSQMQSPDIVLVDDLTFEVIRANGTLAEVSGNCRCFFIFCSSVRYAAFMSDKFPEYSFLTPPPGPNQLARVLDRFFNPDNPSLHPMTKGSSVHQAQPKMTASGTVLTVPSVPKEAREGQQGPIQATAGEGHEMSAPWVDMTKSQVSPQTAPAAYAASNTRLLLVEDNAINMKLLVRFANKHNMPYKTANNGLEAVERHKESTDKRPFNVILMDISMPVMDGLESMRQIRAYEKKLEMEPATIVALTGVVSQTAREDALKAGADIFMSKPAPFTKLKELIMDIHQPKD